MRTGEPCRCADRRANNPRLQWNAPLWWKPAHWSRPAVVEACKLVPPCSVEACKLVLPCFGGSLRAGDPARSTGVWRPTIASTLAPTVAQERGALMEQASCRNFGAWQSAADWARWRFPLRDFAMTLPCVEIETAANPGHAVIWLHGLGADGNDFAPLVPQLVDPNWPPLRFVFPHAPTRAVTINGGMQMRAWYDILGARIADKQDEAGIRDSIGHLDALIAREGERGIPASRVLIAGFSQGGAIALAGSLRHASALAGVIALSTYLPLDGRTAAERSAANAQLPVFMGHGSQDPVVPQGLGLASRDLLRQLGHEVAWHSYPMAHQVCLEEIADLRDWISARLTGALPAA